MIKLIPLALLLAVLGAPAFPGTDGVRVAFREDGPPGIFGVACDAQFESIPDNAQALCEGMPDRSVILYEDTIRFHAKRDNVSIRDLVVNLLHHETGHLNLGVDEHADNPWEVYRHPEIIEAACEYQWHPYCRGWLGLR